MNRIIFSFCILLLSATVVCFANQADQVITLKDGSQIKGELTGIANGVYTIKTPIIGDVHVAANDVSSITHGDIVPTVIAPVNTSNAAAVPAAGASNTSLDQQIMAQQQKLMQNPQAMAELQLMTQDPEIMQALSDPDLVKAVTSHNYQAVQNNPKIQALMQNPKMQVLLQKMASQMQQQNTTSQ